MSAWLGKLSLLIFAWLGSQSAAKNVGLDDQSIRSFENETLEAPSLTPAWPADLASDDQTCGGAIERQSLDRHLVHEHPVAHLIKSLACVGVATGGLVLLDRLLPINFIPIVYLIPVVIAATRWGTWPAITAALSSGAAADFFFFTPYYSFRIDDPQEIFDLILFLFVALVSSHLASRLRTEKEALRESETELKCLYDFSRQLAACFTIPDLINAVQNYLDRALGQRGAFFIARNEGNHENAEAGAAPLEVLEQAGLMIADANIPGQTVIDEPTGNSWLLRAVRYEAAFHGVIAVNIGSAASAVTRARASRIEALLDEASLTLQRLDIGRAMEDARLQMQTQLLKDALHGMLSHELRSPLTAIGGSASVLRSAPAVRADQRLLSLTDAIAEEVESLDRFIQNLVNTARVTTNSVKPRLQWADPKDIVSAVIRSRSRRLADHRIQIEFDVDLPLVNVDSALVEESLGQLLDNAAKYSPSGSLISVAARAREATVAVSVTDQGVGLTLNDRRKLGLRSFRSDRHRDKIPGSGVGFWIASTFIRANGGTIDISGHGEGLGTTASILLPASWVKETGSDGVAS